MTRAISRDCREEMNEKRREERRGEEESHSIRNDAIRRGNKLGEEWLKDISA